MPPSRPGKPRDCGTVPHKPTCMPCHAAHAAHAAGAHCHANCRCSGAKAGFALRVRWRLSPMHLRPCRRFSHSVHTRFLGLRDTWVDHRRVIRRRVMPCDVLHHIIKMQHHRPTVACVRACAHGRGMKLQGSAAQRSAARPAKCMVELAARSDGARIQSGHRTSGTGRAQAMK